MLKVAESNARAEGVAGRVRFMKGDAKALPFENEEFDAVFSHNMMHHLPDPQKLVNEMARVVKKDGAFLLRDLKRHTRVVTELHVQLFGLPYNKMMKKEYRDSILAALSEKEWQELFSKMNIAGGRLSKQFLTHMSIERPSRTRSVHSRPIPTPWHLRLAKAFYVSKWKQPISTGRSAAQTE
jgi:SAM-dependent methyltransferase